jgi:hypothetical protein
MLTGLPKKLTFLATNGVALANLEQPHLSGPN